MFVSLYYLFYFILLCQPTQTHFIFHNRFCSYESLLIRRQKTVCLFVIIHIFHFCSFIHYILVSCIYFIAHIISCICTLLFLSFILHNNIAHIIILAFYSRALHLFYCSLFIASAYLIAYFVCVAHTRIYIASTFHCVYCLCCSHTHILLRIYLSARVYILAYSVCIAHTHIYCISFHSFNKNKKK